MLGVNLQKSHQEVAVFWGDSLKTLVAGNQREAPGFVAHFAKFEGQMVVGMPLAY
jgi:hypothetical protein